jgi:hypothetical protein
MDVYCRHCGEPWDMDTFHDVAAEEGTSYDVVARAFATQGCEAVGASHGEVDAARAEIAGMAFDLLGDDIDGVAAELDDAEACGLLD